MTSGLPPGLQLQATLFGKAGEEHQLRIVGDERRGFLLVGLSGLVSQEMEFWYAELADAIEAAARLGVPADAWSRISAIDEVRTQKL